MCFLDIIFIQGTHFINFCFFTNKNQNEWLTMMIQKWAWNKVNLELNCLACSNCERWCKWQKVHKWKNMQVAGKYYFFGIFTNSWRNINTTLDIFEKEVSKLKIQKTLIK